MALEIEKRAGRKPKITREQVNEIIYLFKNERAVTGRIKYMDVFEFNKELYETGRVSILMGEDFWRKAGRLGKEMIDQANEVFAHKFSIQEGRSKNFPRVVDVVHKYFGDANEMVKQLLPMERKLQQNYKNEQKLIEEITELKGQLANQKEKYEKLQKEFSNLQDVLYKMLRYSTFKDVPLRNQLNTGSSQTEIVRRALEGIFGKPDEFYDWYESKSKDDSKIVSMPSRNKESIAEKIKNRFKQK